VRCALVAVLTMLLASSAALAQENENDSGQAGFPLNTQNGLGALSYPADVRLGSFAVDLGLPNEGDRLSIQRSYALAGVLSAVVEEQLERTSHGDCHLFLAPLRYPFLRGFMYRSDDAEPSEKARPFCFGLLKQVLSAAWFGDSLIRRQVAETERRAQDYSPADAKRTGVPLMLDDFVAAHDALRAIYDERSTVHALLSLKVEQYASITPEGFRDWVEQIRQSGRIRLLTEDQALQRDLQLSEQDRRASLPPMRTQKTSAEVISLSEMHTQSFRAAVMIAIDALSDPRLAKDPAVNDVVKKYCPATKSEIADPVRNPCSFEDIFGRETWICFFFLTDASPDDRLNDAVAKIATDPAVIALAARKHEGGRAGKPYIVWFGRPQP
jgi:hypothetical protein